MFSLQVGYSTCPNDTYIFAALAEDRIETPLILEPVLADVEQLNQWALEERLEVTKLSFHALAKVRPAYGLLNCGAALGRGCGPLLVARPGTDLADLATGKVAAPGELTTARLLLSLFNGQEPNFEQMIFSDVMSAVAQGRADFGLIIHEGRFTYADHGLVELLDLGQWWESETGKPIPLGGIAIRRDLGQDLARAVDGAVRQSILSARTDPQAAQEYIRAYAQEMDQTVIDQHIGLYVNEFSFELGDEGREAVETLYIKAAEAGLVKPSPAPLMAY